MKLLFLFSIILIIQINGYLAKKSFKATKSISHSKDSSEYSKVSKDHSKPKTTKSTTTVATTSTTVHTTVDPFKNPVLFNSTVKESIRTELASAIPNLNQTKFDEFFSALNVIYTLFLQLPYNSSAQICNIIYNAYISGDSTLNSAVLTNVTNLISAKLCINKKQTNLIISAFQQVYGVALSLPVSVIINISAITSSASGTNLPPPPPSPFQNLSTFNSSVNDMIKAELANISTLTASQQEYFISQVNVIYTVTSQLPISTSSAISSTFFSAFVTGSSSIDQTTLSNIKSQLSAALPNLTSIQLNSVANAFKYLYESFSTSTISGIINILAIISSASGISIPPPTLTPPIPFDNMTTFDSTSVSNGKQELVSAIPNLTPEQLDFIINEANIMYSVASRMNNDSREAIFDILFNAFINGDTYLDASVLLEVSTELSTALPDITTDQKNIILFALRLLFEFKSILPFNTLVDIYGIVSSGSGIYVQIPQPPFENLSSLDSSTLTNVIDNVKAAFPNYTQSQLDSVTTALTIINTVHRQLPLSSISTIAEIMYNASITQTSALDSILTRISNELEAALPTLNQTQIARVLNAGKNLFAVAQAMPFDKFVNIGLILTNYSDIVATLPPPPFENMVTLSNAVIINIVDLVRTKIPSMVQFHIDVAISQMNILYNLVSQLPTNTLSNIYDIFFNAYISSDSYLDSTAMSAISTDISSSLPTLTSSQLNSIMLACNYLFVVAQTVPLDVILDIGNIINGPTPNNQYPNLVTMDSAISSKVAENLIIGIPNITQSQIDTTIFDINVLFTVYTQLPASAISNLNDLAYNVSISASSSFDSSAILNLTKTIHGAIPNITAFEMSTLLNSLFNLTEIATILPFNIFVNVSGILTSSSGFALPLPTAPFDNMRTFSASTVTSVKGEIMAGLSSISNSQLDYIIFQMNIVYTVASQLPTNVLSTINSVIYGEYIYLSPYLGSDPTSNIANETLTALPSIDPRQLKSFIDAIKFLFVSATPLPFSAILNIYTYVGAEANISLPMPLPPPVFKNMVNFDQPVEDAIMNALITEIIKITSVNVTVAQFQPYMDAINVVYNVAQRVPLNLSVAIQQLMYDSYISEINYIDSTNTAYLIQELQSAIPNINNYQLNIIYGSFTMLLQMAYALSVNAVLNIYSIASNGSIVSLPSPTPFSIIPIPDNQAVDNISAIIMAEHPDGDLLKINKIIYAMDIIYTVTNMLPLNVVFNISGIAYNAYPINSPPTTALLSDALQNITEFDAGTQTQIRNVLISALPSFTESQVNQTMSAINLLHSVALSLTSNAINNIISIAYSIIGFY